MTLRWPRFVTVPTRGPRTIGSAAPHTTGMGFGPCPPGCEGSTIALGCFFFGFGLTLVSGFFFFFFFLETSGHPGGVRLERPLGGDLLQVRPELHATRAGD